MAEVSCIRGSNMKSEVLAEERSLGKDLDLPVRLA